MSRSPLLDLSRLGSDERHRALAPAFSIGAIARVARPAATAAALSAAPVNMAGVGSAAADRERPRPVGQPTGPGDRPSERWPRKRPTGTMAEVTETKETTSPLGFLAADRPVTDVSHSLRAGEPLKPPSSSPAARRVRPEVR